MFRIILTLFFVTTLAHALTDRELAEWALRWEGTVLLEGGRQPITDLTQLPAGEFKIAGIDLTGSVMVPAELEKLSGLTSLRELYLPGPIWNPGGGNEDANDVFKHLATLKNLEKLYFGWHFSAQTNVRDTGLRHLLGLTELKDLRCAQCRVTSLNMSTWAKLRSLDLSYSPFTDAGLEGLSGLKELRRLILRDTMVTDEGLRHLSNLTQLEELDLSGTRVTERGLEALRKMTAMRKLNLLGARATDATMEILAGMEHLQVVNLYRTGITNAGVTRLQGLKELADVDLRYTRVTSNGIDALRAALPNAKVQFVGSSTIRPKTAGAARPATNNDHGISEWVKAMGGSTEFAGERLKAVSLSSTSVSDAQLSFLAGLTGLEKLSSRLPRLATWDWPRSKV